MRILAPILALFLTPAPASAGTHTVVLQGPVDAESVAQVMDDLAHTRDYAVLRIDSPGGSVQAGFLLMRAIEDSKIPVTCIVDGTAASMAALLLQSCKVRIMTKRSVLMFHEPSIKLEEFGGHENAWRSIADRLRAMHKGMVAFVCARLHLTVPEYIAKTQGGAQWWLTFDEALAVGAVDRVVNSASEVGP